MNNFKDKLLIILIILFLSTSISMAHYRNKSIELSSNGIVKKKQKEINRLNDFIDENIRRYTELQIENNNLKNEIYNLDQEKQKLNDKIKNLESELPKQEDIYNKIEGTIKNDQEMCKIWSNIGFNCLTSHK